MPGTLYFDKQGIPHGTGDKKYFYESDALKLHEYYHNGKVSKSIWYKPDGTIVATTNWENGSGVGYYLRDNGSIRIKMQYINGVAHGQATCYSEDGTVEKYVKFRNGVEVED